MPKKTSDLLSINNKKALDRVMRLMAVPGKSCQEALIAKQVLKELKSSGVPASAIVFDQAHKKSIAGGEIGNLICTLPGTVKGPRRLLMAHMDTVPLCVGCVPKRKGNRIVSARSDTALGGDDRGGVGVVLTAVDEMLRRKLPHPPLTLMFAVQEEIGMLGVRFANIKKLRNPKLCFNWDGGSARDLFVGATGAYRIEILVHGMASHAGVHPERGVSAITIAGLAIADLEKNGWLGDIRKGSQVGTSNIGIVKGGQATNVVTEEVYLKAEARSPKPTFRKRIVKAFKEAFQRAAKKVKNHKGQCGRITFKPLLSYEAFKLGRGEPCLKEAIRALGAEGLDPNLRVVAGGLDANWMARHGLPTVTLAMGQSNPHTVQEFLKVDDYLAGCRIALRVATGL